MKYFMRCMDVERACGFIVRSVEMCCKKGRVDYVG